MACRSSADIPVDGKIRLLDMLSETGLKEIAVGSFVSPRWVPQMACIDELVKGFHPKPGVSYTATALNDMGRERLRQYIPPLNDLKYQAQTAVYLCDVFAQRNINRTIAQQMARWPKAIDEAKAKGAKEAGISVSAAWGSNWTGEVSQDDRMKMLERQHQREREFLSPRSASPIRWVEHADQVGANLRDPALAGDQVLTHLHNTGGSRRPSYVAMQSGCHSYCACNRRLAGWEDVRSAATASRRAWRRPKI
jgi:hydroxymethylglutaryl-CoA lyase